jgi:TfoX/Sxy family transcriptional regulator of competence genes
MTYDEHLADEIRERLGASVGEVTEKRMFGGLAFMIEGNLTIAASRRGGILVRTDPDEAAEIAALPGVEPMSTGGRRPMPGWFFVAASALASETALDEWIDRTLAYVTTLPPK